MRYKGFLVVVAMLMTVSTVTLVSCKDKKPEKQYHDYFDKSQLKYINQLGKRPQLEDRHELTDTLRLDRVGNHHIYANPPQGKFGEIFNDTNPVQIPYAKKNGIEPINNLHDAYRLRQPLVKIETCEAYYLDSLTHSMPYLVPKAAKVLEEIGCAFADTIKARGGSAYRIVVTSCTRSQYTVNKLLKVNNNASERSCHMNGTTFDLSWVHFEPLDNDFILNRDDLRNVLGEILYKFKLKKRCTVLYEEGQCCFHITVI